MEAIKISSFENQQNEFYSESYSNLMNRGTVGKIWQFIHQKMEKPFKNIVEDKVLEIGCGDGEHLKAISSNIKLYYATDIRIDWLLKNLNGRKNTVVEKQDAMNLTYSDNFFDRIIVTCVLMHLDNPILALQEMKRVLKPGGYLSLYLPCEPGIFLRIVRKLVTHPKAKRQGLDNIAFIHFIEHRNYFTAVDFFVRREFQNSKIQSRYYPFFFLTWNFNLFRLYTIKKYP